MTTVFDQEPEHRAEATIDRIVVRDRAHHRRRERALGTREALEALQFEAIFLHVVSASMRDGATLTDEDHDRLVVACGRINVIVDEAVR